MIDAETRREKPGTAEKRGQAAAVHTPTDAASLIPRVARLETAKPVSIFQT
jgi:hypothetical protein